MVELDIGGSLAKSRSLTSFSRSSCFVGPSLSFVPRSTPWKQASDSRPQLIRSAKEVPISTKSPLSATSHGQLSRRAAAPRLLAEKGDLIPLRKHFVKPALTFGEFVKPALVFGRIHWMDLGYYLWLWTAEDQMVWPLWRKSGQIDSFLENCCRALCDLSPTARLVLRTFFYRRRAPWVVSGIGSYTTPTSIASLALIVFVVGNVRRR
ncbi:hypothetical protein B0H16DRAFT_1466914 [Mycena metata]|uniref:Uncharacterized protein n=1 Tax=Mycena metata TaxID=1033252 RepID=A0AAD7MWN6_9AGAR|nr:hypothetical protein B0H16DRAFT_1466914 [Mycena metata]